MCSLHLPNGIPWLLPVLLDSMCARIEPQVWLRVNHLVTHKTLIARQNIYIHLHSTFIYLCFVHAYLLDIGQHTQILLFALCLVCTVCKIVAFDQWGFLRNVGQVCQNLCKTSSSSRLQFEIRNNSWFIRLSDCLKVLLISWDIQYRK